MMHTGTLDIELRIGINRIMSLTSQTNMTFKNTLEVSESTTTNEEIIVDNILSWIKQVKKAKR